MSGSGSDIARGALLAALCCLLAAPAAAMPPLPFEAGYQLHRNGKLAGEAEFTLRFEGDEWHFQSVSRGTRGLARLLGFRDEEFSHGRWHEAGPVPLSYSHKVRTVATTDSWSARFDWEKGRVHTRHEDGESTLALAPGVVDPATLAMVLRAGLAEGMQRWDLKVVDEDEIEDQVYRVAATRDLDTALGCVPVIMVERVRPGSTRFTRSYHARPWAYLPVRIEHGKPDADRYTLSIQTLTLDGTVVEAAEPCARGSGHE